MGRHGGWVDAKGRCSRPTTSKGRRKRGSSWLGDVGIQLGSVVVVALVVVVVQLCVQAGEVGSVLSSPTGSRSTIPHHPPIALPPHAPVNLAPSALVRRFYGAPVPSRCPDMGLPLSPTFPVLLATSDRRHKKSPLGRKS